MTSTTTTNPAVWYQMPAGYAVAKLGRKWAVVHDGATGDATYPRRSDAIRAARVAGGWPAKPAR